MVGYFIFRNDSRRKACLGTSVFGQKSTPGAPGAFLAIARLPAFFTACYEISLTVRVFRDQYMYVCMVITYSKSKDRPGWVANPTRGQLNRKNEFFPVPVRA